MVNESLDWKQAYQDLASLIALRDIQISANTQETFEPLLYKLRHILNFNAISLFLYDEDSENKFICEYQYNFDKYLIHKDFFALVSDIYYWVLNKGTRVYFPSEIAPGLNDLYIPLTIFESKLGVLHIITEADPVAVTQHQDTVLTIFANQISRSLQYLKALRKEKENYENLLQYEKINLLGYVLSGVIHEINNPLTAMIGYSSMMLESIEKLEKTNENPLLFRELSELTTLLNKESNRASTIVKSLLKYVRKTDIDEDKSQVNIHDIILNCIDLMQYNFKIKNINSDLSLNANNCIVIGDMIQLQQALFNVLNNAEQALSESTLMNPMLTIKSSQEQGYILISIHDNGKGISNSDIVRIFDPFFTTKGVGKGTGLGLSLCYKIVTEHKGKIWAENQPEGGVTFFFKLPVVAPSYSQPAALLSGGDKRLKKPEKSHFKILIVDDEVTIVHLLKKILGQEGYLVESTGSIDATKSKINQETFHLIIVDLHLQDGSGKTLYEWIESKNPSLSRAIIFLTGSISNSDIRQFVAEKNIKCLYKPFFPKELLVAVQQILRI